MALRTRTVRWSVGVVALAALVLPAWRGWRNHARGGRVVLQCREGSIPRQARLLQSAEALDSLRVEGHATCDPYPEAPEVNWREEAVVFASFGPFASSCCGFDIRIDSVRPAPRELVVYARLDHPGAGCGGTDDLISPVEAVAIPRAWVRPTVRYVARFHEGGCR
jgi:hypothetical protein